MYAITLGENTLDQCSQTIKHLSTNQTFGGYAKIVDLWLKSRRMLENGYDKCNNA